ncbi:MAG TPA: hypothetical protein VHD36_08770 [Pirellulales bacterium]|nr:hypothetical protein [Pirellulales bacterium]
MSGVLMRMPLPAALVELLPESVARENRIVIFDETDRELMIAADLRRLHNSPELEWLAKLRFILNREILCVHATRQAIDFAIDRDYWADDDS